MSALYPATPGMVNDLAEPPVSAPPQPPNTLYPATPGMTDDLGGERAQEDKAPPSAEPDPAVLATHYPIQFAEDFIPHEPAVNSFRSLAARLKLSPAAAQELAAFHVAELRRLAEIEDPAERARALYSATPGMRP